MKRSENLSELSNEQVLKNLKIARTVLISFSVIFFIMIITCAYISITQGFGVFTFLPLAFLPVLIANIMSHGKVKEEAKSRNLIK
ncbi:MAG: hypothetical protein J0I88_01015 [Chryseobacterium sp.]|nr:hypothetical protein [Chryseobacterium sp.]OJX30652.1 MAG: hypothetical protein BGO86_10940 [Chryseobacterium sp. 36-9]